MVVDAAPMQCHCVRCGHKWWTRTPEKPKRCALCKALYWDRPARVPQPKMPKGPRGKPRKYPIDKMEVGDEVILPFHWLPGFEPDTRKNASMQSAIQSYAKRSGKQFRREIMGVRGIRVTRLA